MFPIPWNKAYRKKDGTVVSIDDAMLSALPIASPSTLGGIKVGPGLSIDENGELSASGDAFKIFTYESTAALSPGNDGYIFGNTLSNYGMETGDELVAIEPANNVLIDLRGTNVSGGAGKAYKDLVPTDTIYVYGKCVTAVSGTTTKACVNFIYKKQ